MQHTVHSSKDTHSQDSIQSNHTFHTVPFPILHKNLLRKNSNYIRTTKYTLLTFLPLNLFFQFRRIYNVYFLLAAISVFPGIGESSLSPITQIFPICFVLFLGAVKDAIEDYNRYKQDKLANNSPATVIRNGQKIQILARNIQPGDLIYFVKEEKFSVDCVLISSNYDDGAAYVDTAELDGETNLKRRTSPSDLVSYNTHARVMQLNGEIQCEHPNQNLLAFQGRISLAPTIPTKSKNNIIPLNIDNLLLRGAILKNTEFAWALVLFTGKHTKIMKNLKRAANKRSSLEISLNKFVFYAFLLNMALLASSVLLESQYYYYFRRQEEEGKDYLWYIGGVDDNVFLHIKTTILSFFALFAYVIPISLFVSVEVVRLCQGLFMYWDHKMMYIRTLPNGDKLKQRMRPNNTSLNEELGMVQYIFSDKTGTLTQNDMILSKWFVNGVLFHELNQKGSIDRTLNTGMISPTQKLDSKTREYLILFQRALALAHSVIPTHDEKSGLLIYEAQSPDETAMLNSTRDNGFELRNRSKTRLEIRTKLKYPSGNDNMGILGARVSSDVVYTPDGTTTESYQQLLVLDFTSDRKRMSSIVRTPNGDIHLYSKGADNIMFARLDTDTTINPPHLLTQADEMLEELSEEGLRTLVVAWKPLTEQEFEAFKREYDDAEIAISNREERLASACEKIEVGLRFLGVTAIEDRLQDEVPETIDYLLKADIRLWLLTGDKQETAINIGMSSKLISADMKVYILRGKTDQELIQSLDRYIQEIRSSPPTKKNALVVNGDALSTVFASPKTTQKLFLNVGVACHSVICCRVTPLQKALVVKLVQSNLKCVTLAIGDGANDVSMIQSANIGVGIMGREGTQAVRASDYAFAEFRFLRRLVGVHGRWSYMRLSGLVMYSFYKNIAMIMVMWLFGFQNLFSGQIVYEEIFMTAYNIIFTSIPPIIYAIFDRDLNDDKIQQYPKLFREVKGNSYWNIWVILGWLVSSFWHSIVVFGSIWYINQDGSISNTGRTTGYQLQTTLFGTPMLVTVLLKFSLITHTWVWLTAASIALSLILNFIGIMTLQYFGFSAPGNNVISHGNFVYYLCILLLPVMSVLPDFTIMYVKRQWFPHDADIIAEEGYISRNNAIFSDGVDIEMSSIQELNGGLRQRNNANSIEEQRSDVAITHL